MAKPTIQLWHWNTVGLLRLKIPSFGWKLSRHLVQNIQWFLTYKRYLSSKTSRQQDKTTLTPATVCSPCFHLAYKTKVSVWHTTEQLLSSGCGTTEPILSAPPILRLYFCIKQSIVFVFLCVNCTEKCHCAITRNDKDKMSQGKSHMWCCIICTCWVHTRKKTVTRKLEVKCDFPLWEDTFHMWHWKYQLFFHVLFK